MGEEWAACPVIVMARATIIMDGQNFCKDADCHLVDDFSLNFVHFCFYNIHFVV